MPSTPDRAETGADSSEWKYEESDVIRETEEQFAPGGVAIGRSEYKVKLRLRREADGERYYQVELEEGGTHLYTADAIEHAYHVVDDPRNEDW